MQKALTRGPSFPLTPKAACMATIKGSDIQKVVVACDAGMGSSVMLASQLRRQLKKHQVTVEHTPVNSIPADADVVVCHAGLAARARGSAPDKVDRAGPGVHRRPGRDPAGEGRSSPAARSMAEGLGVAARPARHSARRDGRRPRRAHPPLRRGAGRGRRGRIRRTSTRCSTASSPSPRTSARVSRSRTAPWPARRPCSATRWPCCASRTASTGAASRSPSASRIAARGDGHVEVLGELAQILLDPDRAAALRAATDPATVYDLLTPIEETA